MPCSSSQLFDENVRKSQVVARRLCRSHAPNPRAVVGDQATSLSVTKGPHRSLLQPVERLAEATTLEAEQAAWCARPPEERQLVDTGADVTLVPRSLLRPSTPKAFTPINKTKATPQPLGKGVAFDENGSDGDRTRDLRLDRPAC